MHFGLALDSSDIDLWNIDLLDTHLDLFIQISPLNILFLSRKPSRDVFKTSLRCLQRKNFSSFKTSSLKTSWKTKNCHAEDVLKTSSRHVLKTNKCLLGCSKSRIMANKCIVMNCSTSYNHVQKKASFPFPWDQELKRKWIYFVNWKD